MRISDWSSDVCSSDLLLAGIGDLGVRQRHKPPIARPGIIQYADDQCRFLIDALRVYLADNDAAVALSRLDDAPALRRDVLSDVELLGVARLCGRLARCPTLAEIGGGANWSDAGRGKR